MPGLLLSVSMIKEKGGLKWVLEGVLHYIMAELHGPTIENRSYVGICLFQLPQSCKLK